MKKEITLKNLQKSFRTAFIRVYEQHINTNEIKEILDNILSIKEYAFILHNKDKKTNGEIKDPHFHILIRFKHPTIGVDFIPKLAKVKLSDTNAIELINDSGLYIQTAKSFKNCLFYLIHKNDKSKYQYSPSEVVSNFDYEDEIKEELENNRDIFIQEQIESYTLGNINLIELRELITPLEFLRNDNIIYRASKVRLDYSKNNNRKMKVIYITGKSGIGKTFTAKNYLKNLGYQENNIFISGSSNDFLEDYEGQKSIILDDIRGNSLTYNDLIKMLDNHTSSKVKSRYLNKRLECDIIIITSVIPPNQLYDYSKMNDKDSYQQLFRRIVLYEIHRQNKEYWLFQIKGDNDMIPITKIEIPDKYKKEYNERVQEVNNSFRNMKGKL